MPRSRLLLLAGPAALAACSAASFEDASVGLAPSLLPNLGAAASLAVPFRAGGADHVEARFTYQFADDEAFADDGNPPAGDWPQLDVGWFRFHADARRTWSVRAGLTVFDARGEPNLAEEPGEYVGVYLGGGRFVRLAPGWWLGPELTLIFATGPDPSVWIPQITWGIRWIPGAG